MPGAATSPGEGASWEAARGEGADLRVLLGEAVAVRGGGGEDEEQDDVAAKSRDHGRCAAGLSRDRHVSIKNAVWKGRRRRQQSSPPGAARGPARRPCPAGGLGGCGCRRSRRARAGQGAASAARHQCDERGSARQRRPGSLHTPAAAAAAAAGLSSAVASTERAQTDTFPQIGGQPAQPPPLAPAPASRQPRRMLPPGRPRLHRLARARAALPASPGPRSPAPAGAAALPRPCPASLPRAAPAPLPWQPRPAAPLRALPCALGYQLPRLPAPLWCHPPLHRRLGRAGPTQRRPSLLKRENGKDLILHRSRNWPLQGISLEINSVSSSPSGACIPKTTIYAPLPRSRVMVVP